MVKVKKFVLFKKKWNILFVENFENVRNGYLTYLKIFFFSYRRIFFTAHLLCHLKFDLYTCNDGCRNLYHATVYSNTNSSALSRLFFLNFFYCFSSFYIFSSYIIQQLRQRKMFISFSTQFPNKNTSLVYFVKS